MHTMDTMSLKFSCARTRTCSVPTCVACSTIRRISTTCSRKQWSSHGVALMTMTDHARSGSGSVGSRGIWSSHTTANAQRPQSGTPPRCSMHSTPGLNHSRLGPRTHSAIEHMHCSTASKSFQIVSVKSSNSRTAGACRFEKLLPPSMSRKTPCENALNAHEINSTTAYSI